MATWIIIAAYVIGYLAFWRISAYYIASGFAGEAMPVGEFLVAGIFLGFLLALFWPLIALGLIVRRVYLQHEAGIAALIVPRSVLKRVELEKREQRIEAMEREVGINAWRET